MVFIIRIRGPPWGGMLGIWVLHRVMFIASSVASTPCDYEYYLAYMRDRKRSLPRRIISHKLSGGRRAESPKVRHKIRMCGPTRARAEFRPEGIRSGGRVNATAPECNPGRRIL